MKVLHLLLRANETSAPWNEHVLAAARGTEPSVATWFPSEVPVPPGLPVEAGDGTLRGAWRALDRALRADPEVLHVHAVHFAPLLAARRRLPPILLTLHTSYPNVKSRNRLLAGLAFRTAAAVACCSRASLESLPSGLARRARRLEVVPNGVDLSRIDRHLARRPPGTGPPAGDWTVASVGRLIPVKDPGTLVVAMDGLAGRPIRLALAGAGHLLPGLRAEVDRRGLHDRVTFTGPLPREAVFGLLAGASAFVSASRVEGLPVATLEAMACGLPVVLSDIPAHREIASGEPGVALVPPGDAPGFARALVRLHEMPADERADLGRRLRRLVEERFSLARMHRSYLRAYERLAAVRA